MRPESHGEGPKHYVAVVSGLVFEVYPLTGGQESTASTRLGFRVDAVDERVSTLVQAGGSLVSRPRDVTGGRHAVVADPDGHRVELFTPAAEDQSGVDRG